MPAPKPTKLWKIANSPGKGRGLFATQDLPTGTLIMADSPLMSMPRFHKGPPIGHAEVKIAYDKLSSKQQKLFMSLSDSGKRPENKHSKILRIWHTNALTDEDSDQVSIFPEVSLINHSCAPNAFWTFRPQTGKCLVTATTHIRKGEEIFLNYDGDGYWMTAAQRKTILKHLWGFDCTCTACTSVSCKSNVSDLRRVLIAGLFCILEKHDGMVEGLYPSTIAAMGKEGKDTFSVVSSRVAQYTTADYTFAWWLLAQLLEAEGLCNHNLAAGYSRAMDLLQQRLDAAGRAGKKVAHLDAYFDNIRRWTKSAHNVVKLLERRASSPAFTEGQGWWGPIGPYPTDERSRRQIVAIDPRFGVTQPVFAQQSGMAYAAEIYGEDGNVVRVAVHESELHTLIRNSDPGANFCDSYMEQYGHLYQTSP